MTGEMIEPRDLSPAAQSYLNRLKPAERADAREWAVEDDDVFKMRMGGALDELATSVRGIEECVREQADKKNPKISPHVIQALYTTGAIVGLIVAALTGRIPGG